MKFGRIFYWGFSVLYLLIINRVEGQTNVLRINVPSGFSGWAYLVGDTLPIVSKDNTYNLDSTGVVYIDARAVKDLENARIYKDNVEITASGARLMYSFVLNFEGIRHDIEIPVYYFYVLNAKESDYQDDYWRADDTIEKLLLIESARREQLIKRGIIRLQ